MSFGNGKLLWKFDCNPKSSVWKLGGTGGRNSLLTRPTIHNSLVYMTVGQDPEHGEGPGRVWCIDPRRRGDVSAELVFNEASPEKPIPHRKYQAAVPSKGDFIRPNPNSAVVWQYTGTDLNNDGELTFEESMHRSVGQVIAVDNMIFVSDFSGLIHCLDAKSGKANWTYDQFAMCWCSPTVTADHVLISDEDGDIAIFKLSNDPNVALPNGIPHIETNANNSIYSTAVVEQNVLYVLSRNMVYAVADPKKP